MKIAIDCRMINSSGVGVYLRGILPYLQKSNNELFLFGNDDEYAEIKPFSINELFFFPAKLLKQINKCDIYFTPFFNIPISIKIPVYITIHDIIFADMPELTSKTGLAARMFFYKRAYKLCRAVFTVSEFSKSRIEYHLGKAKPVIVTHSALQPFFYEARIQYENIKKDKIIIYIGNIKKHKGLDYLLDAYSLAKKEGLNYKLVIIGSKDNFRTRDNKILQKAESLNSVSFTGFISDNQLTEYLAKASLLVQPSLYEGFCLPPLEAMVLGTHALISDIPVLKEVYKDFPVTFFKAGDTIDLKYKMTELLKNQQPRPKGTGYVASPEDSYRRYTHSGFNTLFNRPEGRDIKPLSTNKNPPVVKLSDSLANKYNFSKTSNIILQNIKA